MGIGFLVRRFSPLGEPAYLSRRLSLATSLKGRGLFSSGWLYENTVGPPCQGTKAFANAGVQREWLWKGKLAG
jgi:hypothetical protein